MVEAHDAGPDTEGRLWKARTGGVRCTRPRWHKRWTEGKSGRVSRDRGSNRDTALWVEEGGPWWREARRSVQISFGGGKQEDDQRLGIRVEVGGSPGTADRRRARENTSTAVPGTTAEVLLRGLAGAIGVSDFRFGADKLVGALKGVGRARIARRSEHSHHHLRGRKDR